MKKGLFLFIFVSIATILLANQNSQKIVDFKNEITKSPRDTIQDHNNSSIQKQWLKPGYQLIIEMGSAFSVGDYSANHLKVNVINGIRINRFLSFGFGIGLEHYKKSDPNWLLNPDLNVAPLFADLRFNYPFNNKVSIFFTFDIGKSLKPSNDDYYYRYTTHIKDLDVLLNPSLGASLKVWNNKSINIGVGYEIQKTTFRTAHWSQNNARTYTEEEHFSKVITLIAGFSL